MPPLWKKPPMESNGCMPSPFQGRTKGHLQDPLQDVPQNTADNKQHTTLDTEPSQQPASGKHGTSQKAEPICMGHFHNRHVFQQQLIKEQKKKLQEQQKTILKLKETQRLAEARWAAERAAAGTDAQSRLLPNPRGQVEPKGTCQTLLRYSLCIRALAGLILWGFLLWGREAPVLLYLASKLCDLPLSKL